jgi:hypothetical protein
LPSDGQQLEVNGPDPIEAQNAGSREAVVTQVIFEEGGLFRSSC